ncbi:MAG: hypothetical protein ACPGJV_12500 [Bacteriovoracaceae bacterium]
MKNWLIRTTNNQILGPVSKQKIYELIRSGKLEDEDEISSGNGYWFWVKEEDLVEKFIIGDVPQDFNPVSESETVLVKRENPQKTQTFGNRKGESLSNQSAEEGVSIPNQQDLMYPDDEEHDDITRVTSLGGVQEETSDVTEFIKLDEDDEGPDNDATIELSLDSLDLSQSNITKDKDEELKLPEEQDLEFPEIEEVEEAALPDSEDLDYPELEEEIEITDGSLSSEKEEKPKIKKREKSEISLDKEEVSEKPVMVSKRKLKVEKPAAEKKSAPKKLGSNKKRQKRRGIDIYFLYFFFITLIILVSVTFYYKKILGKPIPFFSIVSELIINQAQAQTSNLGTKKKL